MLKGTKNYVLIGDVAYLNTITLEPRFIISENDSFNKLKIFYFLLKMFLLPLLSRYLYTRSRLLDKYIFQN